LVCGHKVRNWYQHIFDCLIDLNKHQGRDGETHHHNYDGRASDAELLCPSGGSESAGGRKQHQQKADKPTAQTPKADDKAYSAALKSLPNKPFDPWHGAR
jgi:hypothetical protein